MYVVIDGETYTKIDNLEFSPEADITGNTLPINTFSVDIKTDDEISSSQFAELRDDLGALWAKYWITKAEKVRDGQVHIEAASLLHLLDYDMDAEMYDSTAVSTVIAGIITGIGSSVGNDDYFVDASFSSATITGFCPAQTARQRLQQVCYVIGAYVSSCFSDKLEILPIPQTDIMIPLNMTYRTPKVTQRECTTTINVKYYTLTAGEPAATDKYLTTGNGVYYIVEEMEATITNNNAPAGTPEHAYNINEIYLINGDNVSSVLAHEATLQFYASDVEAAVINNAAYKPGYRVMLCTSEHTLARCYIKSCSFSFGMQAKAEMKLYGIETDIEAAELLIIYECDNVELSRESYFLPVDDNYSFSARLLDQIVDGRRTIYRPLITTIAGTMTSEGAIVTVPCELALTLENDVLTIYSVDEMTTSTETIDDNSTIIGVVS